MAICTEKNLKKVILHVYCGTWWVCKKFMWSFMKERKSRGLTHPN